MTLNYIGINSSHNKINWLTHYSLKYNWRNILLRTNVDSLSPYGPLHIYMGKDLRKKSKFSPLYIYFRNIWTLPSYSLLKMHKYMFLIAHQIISFFICSFQNTQTSHGMSVFGNDVISSNECDSTTTPDIDTIPLTPVYSDSISDVSVPSHVPSHPSNAN